MYAPQPGNGVGDPVAVSRDSLDEARHRMHNIVIIDTAGRLGVDEEMMQQAADIRDATDPDEILFVVDAMIGQDAVTTAQAFLDGVGYDGVVLTKLDGDARGGAALSIAELTGRPVMFASSGEKLEDFDVFHPDRMASRILDLGDMLTLIEQAERTFDQEQTAALAGKLASGEGFTLEDFVQQLAMVRKLGPIGNLLGMLPGAAQNREMLSQVSDKDLDRAAAIVNSMTPAERRNPKIINGSRRARIAGRLRRRRGRGQQPGDQVPRGPEDDAPDDGRRRYARYAGYARYAAGQQAGQEDEEEAEGRPSRRVAGWRCREAAARAAAGHPAGVGRDRRRTGRLGGLPGNLPPGLGGEGGFRLPGPGPGSQPGPQHLPPGLRGGGANRRGKKGR